MALPPLQPIALPIVGEEGKPSTAFGGWLLVLDQIVRGFTGGNAGLINAANDAAAAAAGVKIGQLYRTANTVKIRLT